MSATWPLAVALAAAINADAGVTALAGPDCVFGDLVPSGRALPYVTLGSANESDDPLFMAPDLADGTDLHLWGATRQEVLQLYGAVRAALMGATLTVSGFRLLTARVALVATLTDPTGLAHGVAHYDARAAVTP